jgi:ABC-2 type transport system permease protein
MSTVLTIAQAEFLRLARSKAFIIGILLMPILVGVMTLFSKYTREHIDLEDRRLAVIDDTGVLYTPLAAAAKEFNDASVEGGVRKGPNFVLERVDPAGRSIDEIKLELSNRIRKHDLFAFVIIPTGVLDTPDARRPKIDKAKTDKKPDPTKSIQYHTETISYDALPDWLGRTLDEAIAKQRLAHAGMDADLAARLSAETPLDTYGLVARAADGKVSEAPAVDVLAVIGPPAFFLVLMFMAVMTSAQHLLSAIIEEKMSRICEVLLGSVSPFQLLMGKLVGVSAVAVLLVLVYFAGATFFVFESGRWDLLNPAMMAWFVVFLVCAALMFGAIFLALGSACATISDAQSLLQPAMMLMLVGYLGSFIALRSPDSPLTVGLSFFPTMTPFTMMVRMAVPPGVPLWQVLLAVAELVAATGFVVWAASRVFRIGILMQGKAPTLPELLRWIRTERPERVRPAEAE